VTSAGVAVTGTLSSSGASTFTGTGKFATTIGVGNATPAASGSGITFPATQSASSDVNTLDDYEEGTWTPTDASGAGIDLSPGTSVYVKIGTMVFVSSVLNYGVTASTAGAQFTLPFPPVGGNQDVFGGYIVYSNTALNLTIFTQGSNAAFYTNGSITQTQNVAISSKQLRVVAMYKTS
jgi:hypothetical protein